MVQLKALIPSGLITLQDNFNSAMVQLKDIVAGRSQNIELYFNSAMVQLKVSMVPSVFEIKN